MRNESSSASDRKAGGGGTSGARSIVKLALATAFDATGAMWAFARARRRAFGPRLHILGFHRVVDDVEALGPDVIPSMCLTTSSFGALLDVARARFEVVSLETATEMLAGRRPQQEPDRDLLALTFDDAYRDVYLRALPLLRERRMPATVFVPTGLIGSPEPLLHDRLHALLVRASSSGVSLAAAPAPRLLRRALAHAEALLAERGAAGTVESLIEALPAQPLRRVADAIEDLLGEAVALDDGARVMSEEELRACVDGGLELGGHTVEHVALVREPRARVRIELSRPRRTIEAITGRPCRTFAYCNGLFTPSLRASVHEAGYTTAVTTADHANRPGSDPLTLGRKVLWEGHVRARGRFSRSLSLAQLHDLFGVARGPGVAPRRLAPVRFRVAEEVFA